ncbi:MAG: hypothetical protein HY329_02540 [Chloroflexi bacterium]|nr:hypothetical protein [Chloroflexota bacterium]
MTTEEAILQPATPAPADAATAPTDEIIVIERAKGWVPLDLEVIWRYRELLYFLAWRASSPMSCNKRERQSSSSLTE